MRTQQCNYIKFRYVHTLNGIKCHFVETDLFPVRQGHHVFLSFFLLYTYFTSWLWFPLFLFLLVSPAPDMPIFTVLKQRQKVLYS